MNRAVLILGVLILIVAVGAGFYFFTNQEVAQEGERTKEETVASSTDVWGPEVHLPAKTEPFEASFEEVLASGGDYGCHYTSPPEEGAFTGMVYVSQGRARGTIIGDVFNAPGSMVSFLFTNDRTYLWFNSDAFTTYNGGSLLIEATTTKDRLETRQDVAENLQNLYGCVTWEFDESFFTLPTDITFAIPGEER